MGKKSIGPLISNFEIIRRFGAKSGGASCLHAFFLRTSKIKLRLRFNFAEKNKFFFA